MSQMPSQVRGTITDVQVKPKSSRVVQKNLWKAASRIRVQLKIPVLLKLALDCKKTAGTKIRRPEIVVRAQEGIEVVAPALTTEATKGNTMTREVQRFRMLLRTIKMIAPKIDAKIQGVQLAGKEVKEMMEIEATGIIEAVMEVTRAK